ncbi:MAG TPA: nucleoside-diphosphate sugar epimerase [Ramlibacter sp.]|jgi:uncharacterized protein YbjT (DUF2867 family)|uniref:nucleoside-diphosphate sugar epimerase n=1 Tax=Ramlibacter sp. TaxID=1917967 RepID=UPI002D3DE856|nr:nucleoside-diphosphate sugar epimerase [Ramlibacter sp.]HZY17939.1 nucleoside-diphosphate sugar epimerase [Ramlibacter sp.]
MTARTALLAGATGLVGRELLAGLLADPGLAAVHTLGRRELPLVHAKLSQHWVDFAALPTLPAVDEVYLALGTTIRAAGSQAAFRAIDYDANLAVARAARAAGAKRLGVVSAMGANARSGIFYNRIKGELEEILDTLAYEGLVIARPSFLTGDRAALGQSTRRGETLARRLSTVLRPLIPPNYRAIRAVDVAAALLRAVPHARGRQVLPSGRMQGAGG